MGNYPKPPNHRAPNHQLEGSGFQVVWVTEKFCMLCPLTLHAAHGFYCLKPAQNSASAEQGLKAKHPAMSETWMSSISGMSARMHSGIPGSPNQPEPTRHSQSNCKWHHFIVLSAGLLAECNCLLGGLFVTRAYSTKLRSTR